MIADGDIVLFRFPQTDLSRGKLRPALLLKRTPGEYPDWLVCMISTRLEQGIENFDLILKTSDPDFDQTGLKKDSLFRISRLAIVDENMFEGKLGSISTAKLDNIQERLCSWLRSKRTNPPQSGRP